MSESTSSPDSTLSPSSPASAGMMSVKVRSLSGEVVDLQVVNEISVDEFLSKVEAALTQPNAGHRLIFSGRAVESGTLASHGVRDGSVLYLVSRPPPSHTPAPPPSSSSPSPPNSVPSPVRVTLRSIGSPSVNHLASLETSLELPPSTAPPPSVNNGVPEVTADELRRTRVMIGRLVERLNDVETAQQV